MSRLNEGDRFPDLEADSVQHGRVRLPPPAQDAGFSVILGYRALW